LQSNLNGLAYSLGEFGDGESERKIKSAVAALEQAEQCETPTDVKKKGVLLRLERLLAEIGSKDSKLHKIIASVENGIETAQSIAKMYNKVARS